MSASSSTSDSPDQDGNLLISALERHTRDEHQGVTVLVDDEGSGSSSRSSGSPLAVVVDLTSPVRPTRSGRSTPPRSDGVSSSCSASDSIELLDSPDGTGPTRDGLVGLTRSESPQTVGASSSSSADSVVVIGSVPGQDVIVLDEHRTNGPVKRRRPHCRDRSQPVVLGVDSENDSDELLATPALPLAKKKVVVVVEDETPTKGQSSKPSEASSSSGGGGGGGLSCPICLDTADQIKESGRQLMSTVCGHIYCGPCLLEFFKVHKNCCPMCRKKLTHKQYHPLFV